MILETPRALLFTLALGLPLAACDGETAGEPATEPPPAEEAVTWHQDIAPIIAQRCGNCHVEGGVAPFPLDDFESVSAMAEVALSSIESGRMPPWMPEPDCREFEYERIMPDAEKDLFRAWIAAEKPLGDPETATPIAMAPGPEFDPTHVAVPVEAYTPDEGIDDDYRCFVLDAEFPEPMFLTASDVVPDANALVHHVLVYAIGPEDLDAVLAADADDMGPGYTCFGSPMPRSGDMGAASGSPGLPTQIGAWVPGSVPNVYPDGLAVPIAAGSRIVMQVHYNLIGSESEPDATALEMELTAEPPSFAVSTRPIVIRNLDIPAGDEAAVNFARYRNYSDKTLTIGAVAGHMHTLGTRLHSTVERADGSEQCLLEIPQWDFLWQQGYVIPRDQWVEVPPGDALTIECTYDNSPANQPFVDGQQMEPRDVSWGEGTFDEMCMVYMTLIEPYEPPAPAGTVCTEDDSSCVAACAATGERDTADCIMSCASQASCGLCALRGTFGCGGARCVAPFNALRENPCMENCFINTLMLGGDTTACFKESCAEEYGALSTCLAEVIDTGSCDEAFAADCGLDLSR